MEIADLLVVSLVSFGGGGGMLGFLRFHLLLKVGSSPELCFSAMVGSWFFSELCFSEVV